MHGERFQNQFQNWVFASEGDISNFDLQDIADRLKCREHLQIHSDGGYKENTGAAAVVFLTFALNDGMWTASVLGYFGVLITNAKSVFQAELLAADMAIIKALEIGERCSSI